MKIGEIELQKGLFLAPMAGISDHTFRKICREQGAEYCVTEMVSAKAVYYRDKKTSALSKISDDETPCAVQIFGSDPEIMAQSARWLLEEAEQRGNGATLPCAIDINMGCPVRKVVSGGDGSALMKNPDLAGEIVRRVVNAVCVPVTVKIRSGWDAGHKNAVEIAQIAEEGGAAAITVHGRTRSQMYAPPVDYGIIRDVKRAVSIPVIANGGIFCAQDALMMLENTDCDALMIARGALGNPFLFAEIRAALSGQTYERPDQTTILNTAQRHLILMEAEKGNGAVPEFRKHASWYTKGMRGASAIRGQINHAQTVEEMLTLLDLLK